MSGAPTKNGDVQRTWTDVDVAEVLTITGASWGTSRTTQQTNFTNYTQSLDHFAAET